MPRRPGEDLGDWLDREAKLRANRIANKVAENVDDAVFRALAIVAAIGIAILALVVAFNCVHAQNATAPCGYGKPWHTANGKVICDKEPTE